MAVYVSKGVREWFIVAALFAACWLALTVGKHVVDTNFFTRPSTDVLDIYR